MRKTFLFTLCLMFVVVTVTGCGGGSNTAAGPAPEVVGEYILQDVQESPDISSILKDVENRDILQYKGYDSEAWVNIYSYKSESAAQNALDTYWCDSSNSWSKNRVRREMGGVSGCYNTVINEYAEQFLGHFYFCKEKLVFQLSIIKEYTGSEDMEYLEECCEEGLLYFIDIYK